MRAFILSFLLLSCAATMSAQNATSAKEEPYTPTDEILKARTDFQDMKFGIFIHWGVYSMLGNDEWVMNNRSINYKEYMKLPGGFCPAKFNADKWVEAIKASGAKYITFTSRHHDGFSMFKTAQDTFNIVDDTPFKRDVVGELAAACKRGGLKLHLYYSHLDWHRLDYPLGRTGKNAGRPTDKQSWESYSKFMNAQLTELLTNYGSIGAIWFDGWWDHDHDVPAFDWHLRQQYDLIHRLQPSCLVADNHHVNPFAGEDIQIFERDLPGQNTAGWNHASTSALPLETCETMNRNWGYDITDYDYKSADDIIRLLVGSAGRNANLLLNIGPQPDGQIPDNAIERLKEVGQWMKTYGETIYGTRGGIVAPHDWGATTQKGKRLFVHILKMKDNGLYLPLGNAKVLKAVMFKDRSKVNFQSSKTGVTLLLPSVPNEVDCVVELTLK